mgnify:CR=1 FL=1
MEVAELKEISRTMFENDIYKDIIDDYCYLLEKKPINYYNYLIIF